MADTSTSGDPLQIEDMTLAQLEASTVLQRDGITPMDRLMLWSHDPNTFDPPDADDAEEIIRNIETLAADLAAERNNVAKLVAEATSRTNAIDAFLAEWESELPMEAVADLHRVAAGIWADEGETKVHG